MVPKKEALSRYGNPDQYRVNGIEYNVLHAPEFYQAEGVASWYGPNFHQKRTSSGEVYNMFELTAAHKTLPIPSYVRVKNLENSKEIVVKVNDRGPFHQDRIIDLSYAAATALGFAQKGTARVLVDLIIPKGEVKEKAQWFVQAGAFSKKEGALSLKNKLAGLLGGTMVQMTKNSKAFLVSVGPLTNKAQMEEIKLRLTSLGIKGFSYLK